MTHNEVAELVAASISAQRRDPIRHRSPHQQQAWVAREHLLDELAHDFVAVLALYGTEATRFLAACRVRSEVPDPEGGIR
jgi:hypothetical protein